MARIDSKWCEWREWLLMARMAQIDPMAALQTTEWFPSARCPFLILSRFLC
jgi:hypothetical protein